MYVTAVVSKYLYTDTIKVNPKFHKTALPHYIVFTTEYASTRDEQVESLYRE